VVSEIEQAVCDALDGLLRATGAVQPPMLHMFPATASRLTSAA